MNDQWICIVPNIEERLYECNQFNAGTCVHIIIITRSSIRRNTKRITLYNIFIYNYIILRLSIFPRYYGKLSPSCLSFAYFHHLGLQLHPSQHHLWQAPPVPKMS